MEKLTFNKKNPTHSFKVNKDKPYLKVVKLVSLGQSVEWDSFLVSSIQYSAFLPNKELSKNLSYDVFEIR